MGTKKLPPIGTYPNNLSNLMREFNKNKVNLAHNANLTASYFSAYYNGQRPLLKTHAKRLAKALGCSVNELYSEQSVSLFDDVNDVKNGSRVESLEPMSNPVLVLTRSDTATLVELVERERSLMLSTGRNVYADVLGSIIAKLQNPMKNHVGVKSVVTKPTGPVKTSKANDTKINKFSRPWDIEELASALSALFCGSSAQKVADANQRPAQDVNGIKTIFGWLWTKDNCPKNPTPAEMLTRLNAMVSSNWRSILKPDNQAVPL